MARQNDAYFYHETSVHLHGGTAVDSDWIRLADGTWGLTKNKSAKKMILDIPVNKGDIITGFRVMGGVSADDTTTLDADLRKVTGASGSTMTDASVGAITQVSKTANYEIDELKTLTNEETVEDDYHYYIILTGTTAADYGYLRISGVEVDIRKKLGETAAA